MDRDHRSGEDRDAPFRGEVRQEPAARRLHPDQRQRRIVEKRDRADGARGPRKTVAALPGLRLRGIMGIPEPTPDVTLRRSRFRQLRECFDACRDAGLPVDTLSMGMSADLEDAIAEGATLVRVGTAIFGARDAAGT
jgi:hypothetical protein